MHRTRRPMLCRHKPSSQQKWWTGCAWTTRVRSNQSSRASLPQYWVDRRWAYAIPPDRGGPRRSSGSARARGLSGVARRQDPSGSGIGCGRSPQTGSQNNSFSAPNIHDFHSYILISSPDLHGRCMSIVNEGISWLTHRRGASFLHTSISAPQNVRQLVPWLSQTLMPRR
jgi:hypothetical protein